MHESLSLSLACLLVLCMCLQRFTGNEEGRSPLLALLLAHLNITLSNGINMGINTRTTSNTKIKKEERTLSEESKGLTSKQGPSKL